ncbi:MAG: restriction endonuclease subunit S [Bacteroidales bacterium]|nr:restriction endonuclease subunit S [Bacteroidales bacterium]
MMKGWKYQKLGDVISITMGQSPSSNTYNEDGDGLPFFQGNADFDKEHPKVRVYCNAPVRIADEEDVLISVRAPIGAINIADRECCIGRGLAALRGNKLISNRFLYRFLYASKAKLIAQGTGSTFKSIGKEALSSLMIPMVPISEQKRIVAELDLLTDVIDKQKQQLKELDTLAQSIFYDMFGDLVENEKGWEVKALKDSVIEMFLGPFGSALKTDCYVDKEKAFCMVYEQKHAIKKTMDVETHYIDEEKFNSLRRFEVHSGDFIMSCRGTIGEIYRIPQGASMGIIHPSLMKIRIREDIYAPTFFQWLLSRIIKNENTNGNCVQMAITAKELGKRTPIVPPLAFQESFADKIEAIEQQKENINQSIAETQKLFDYTMDKYFG